MGLSLGFAGPPGSLTGPRPLITCLLAFPPALLLSGSKSPLNPFSHFPALSQASPPSTHLSAELGIAEKPTGGLPGHQAAHGLRRLLRGARGRARGTDALDSGGPGHTHTSPPSCRRWRTAGLTSTDRRGAAPHGHHGHCPHSPPRSAPSPQRPGLPRTVRPRVSLAFPRSTLLFLQNVCAQLRSRKRACISGSGSKAERTALAGREVRDVHLSWGGPSRASRGSHTHQHPSAMVSTHTAVSTHSAVSTHAAVSTHTPRSAHMPRSAHTPRSAHMPWSAHTATP